MTETEISNFEKLQGQVQGLHNEIGTLSKKNPNDAVNQFKLKIINQILIASNEFLVDDYKPLDGFEKFEDENLPTNSDVVLVLEQYLNCLEKLRSDNVTTIPFQVGWYWIVDGEPSELKTYKPLKLK